jgi:sugar/nucleoside kinase (ribokinase family)
VQARLSSDIEKLAERVGAIVVMDQVGVGETGVVTSGLLEGIGRLQAARPELRIVGDSRRSLHGWPPITYKMNAAEIAALVGRPDLTSHAEIRASASEFARRNGQDVFVTLAEKGLLGASPNEGVVHVPALPVRGPIDVVGAGDAVTANLTAALAVGASVREALVLAAAASSIVIHKLGTTGTASREEIGELLAANRR